MSLFEPSEPRKPIHSKTYERGMAVLTILLSVAALFALIYLIPD
jgi:hypothetical protein